QSSATTATPVGSSPSVSSASPEARMQALEERLRALTEELAVLRDEVSTLREASGTPAAGNRVLLTSTQIDPGLLPALESSSTPPLPPPQPVPQAPQTQTQAQALGGATSNAKLLNPDISLIGDFIGVAGHNQVSPSPSLQLHESELGVQAIIDP